MSKDNNNNQNIPNKKEPGHRGGRPDGEKRSNEPARKRYQNHTQEHNVPSENRLKEILGKNFRDGRK